MRGRPHRGWRRWWPHHSRADDWEVSGATDPMTRPQLGPWLRDERGSYRGLVAAAVDRLGRNVVDCLNTGYKMRDEGKLLVTYGHESPWDLDDRVDENRFTMEAWGAQMELRAIQRRNRSAMEKTRPRWAISCTQASPSSARTEILCACVRACGTAGRMRP